MHNEVISLYQPAVPGLLEHSVYPVLEGIGMPSRQQCLPRDDWIMNETSLAAIFGWVILSNGASSVSMGHHVFW